MLAVDSLSVSYGRVPALRDISLTVERGEIVTLIGANGAGKTTLLNTIAGVIGPKKGTITWNGQHLVGLPSYKVVCAGVGYVPEGRQLFGSMRVIDNLVLGTYLDCAKSWYRILTPTWIHMRRPEVRHSLQRVFDLFPILAERSGQQAGSLSGGEQQMLAIGRALMSSPSILLLDEPSVGLAPQLVKAIRSLLPGLRNEGLTILLVEQDAGALKLSDRGYVMEQGRIVLEGPSKDLLQDDNVIRAYLGRSTV